VVQSRFFQHFTGVGLALLLAPEFGVAQTPAGSNSQTSQREPTALERLRSDDDATAKLKEVNPDLGEAKIPEPTTAKPTKERRVLQSASVRALLPEPEPAPGFINETVLRSQVRARQRELDACRPSGSKAAMPPMQLRWTIVPGGHVKNTVVMTERQPTSLEVVKCVRKRMDTWVFASPAGGPVDVETTHTFMTPKGRALEKEMTASTAKMPPDTQPGLQQARQETQKNAPQPTRQPARATTTTP
jgi:hypothetical protein